jgi:predicted Zn-dependent peptidase
VAVATADVWVRTGAEDEPAEVSGISHFLEHMMFKGTEQWGLGEIERAIESVGGVCNAATSYDFTHYYITLPSASIATGIGMLAEMIRNSTLDAEELEKERLVILEEYRRKQDNPAGVLYERLYTELFEAGPYHETVIGSEETIRAITREKMLDYYHKRYSPASAALVLTGDFDPEAAIAEAEKAFSGFDRPLVELRTAPETRYGRGKRVHIDKPTGGEVYVAFAFPAVGMNATEKVVPLDTAQTILGSGRAALLYQTLKEKQALCSSIQTYYPTHMKESLFVVIATCRPEQRAALREGVERELARFAAAAPEEAALRRALRLDASAHRFGMETTGGASSNIGYYYTLSGGTEFLDGYLERLERTTADEVRRAAAETLGTGEIAGAMVEVAVGPDGAGK